MPLLEWTFDRLICIYIPNPDSNKISLFEERPLYGEVDAVDVFYLVHDEGAFN